MSVNPQIRIVMRLCDEQVALKHGAASAVDEALSPSAPAASPVAATAARDLGDVPPPET